MAYNKFIKKDGTVMLDLTDTTVSSTTLGKDIIAIDKYGNKITGTLTDSPLPVEVSTEEEMAALLESGEVGSVYKYAGTTGTYENGALYEITEESDPLKGTWVFNDTLDFSYFETGFFGYFNFICNDINCDEITVKPGLGLMQFLNRDEVSIGQVYYNNTWTDELYKTIEITSLYNDITVSPESSYTKETFLSWLQANATKQSLKTFAKLVIPTGTIEITENGEVDVSAYEKANVNVKPQPIVQLYPPTISISGSTLTITPNPNNEDFVDSYLVNVRTERSQWDELTIPVTTSIDVYDLGYGSVPNSYITIKARGEGFIDSTESNSAFYYDDELQGLWVFNGTLDLSSSFSATNFKFSSDDTQFTRLSYLASSQELKYISTDVSIAVYTPDNGWARTTNPANSYKVIKVTSTYDSGINVLPAGTGIDFLVQFLNANATRRPNF